MSEDVRRTTAAAALAGVLVKSAGLEKDAQGFWESVQPYWKAMQPYLPYAAIGGLGGLLLGDSRSSLMSRLLGGAALGGLGGYGIKNWLMPWIQKRYGQAGEQPPVQPPRALKGKQEVSVERATSPRAPRTPAANINIPRSRTGITTEEPVRPRTTPEAIRATAPGYQGGFRPAGRPPPSPYGYGQW